MSRSLLSMEDSDEKALLALKLRRAKVHQEATKRLVEFDARVKRERAALQREIFQTLEAIDREFSAAGGVIDA